MTYYLLALAGYVLAGLILLIYCVINDVYAGIDVRLKDFSVALVICAFFWPFLLFEFFDINIILFKGRNRR